jgi:hypothetical protein
MDYGQIRELSRIKVLAFEYQVRWVGDPILAGAFNNHGITDSDRLAFTFMSDVPDMVLRDTVLHEIIHALNYHLQLTDGPADEDIASRISTGLLTVFMDNPFLARWLTDPSVP